MSTKTETRPPLLPPVKVSKHQPPTERIGHPGFQKWLKELKFPFPRELPYYQSTTIPAVVPGQPLSATFSLYTFEQDVDWGTGYQIRLYFERSVGDEVLIYQDPPDSAAWLPYAHPRWSLHPQPAPQYEIDPAAHVVDVLDQYPPGSPIGDDFYSFGTKSLRTEITTNGPDMLVFSLISPVNVIPCENQAFWFSWSPSNPVGAAWKSKYMLSGSIVDPDPYVGMNISIDLIEQDEDDNVNVVATTNVQVDPSINGVGEIVTFPAQEQSWPWLVPGVWAPENPDLGKQFTYYVITSALDDFGNQYPIVTGNAQWPIIVNVSNRKVDLAIAAFSTQISAVVFAGLSAIPIAGVVFAVLAAAAAAAAAILGEEALDPPSPSPKFLEEVKVKKSKVQAMSAGEGLAPVLSLIQKFEEAGLYLEALSEVESRYLGALQVTNREGMRMQAQRAAVIKATMANSTTSLISGANAAVNAVKQHYPSTKPYSNSEFSKLSSKAISEMKISENARGLLNEFAKEHDFLKETHSAEFLVSLLLTSAVKIANVCRTIYT